MLDTDAVRDELETLAALRDPELVLLKGHLLVERVLIALVALRTAMLDVDIPKLSFPSLVSLACAPFTDARVHGDIVLTNEWQRKLLWVNELRNRLAHELHALDSPEFSSVVRRFGLPWPDGTMERCLVLEWVVRHAHDLAYYSYASQRYPAAIFVELGETLEGYIQAHNRLIDVMKDGYWDVLIEGLRDHGPRRLA
jgi:hypothetical protein